MKLFNSILIIKHQVLFCRSSPEWVCVFGSCCAFAADELLMVLSICWNCSCVRHTTLAFCCVTVQESFLLLSDWTLTASLDVLSGLHLALVILGLCDIFWPTELTAGASLLLFSCSALSGCGGPCLELMILCVFFFGGILNTKNIDHTQVTCRSKQHTCLITSRSWM